MTVYAVTYSYGDPELTTTHRPAHREYLAQLHESGNLHAAGAFLDGEPSGALLIFVADDRAHLDQLIAADPMSTGGALVGYTVREWNAVIGKVGC
ncbi:YciI family protein [Rothia nasimurium]|uniref:YciI family protein n=1 Tax=Rothia nasimurium TaxID=85336 RepID=UPI001F1B26BD|nr:GNAT family N-acetyltransferase [Rothia nasimurium]